MHTNLSSVGVSGSSAVISKECGLIRSITNDCDGDHSLICATPSPASSRHGADRSLTEVTSPESTPETHGGKRRRRRPKYGRLKRVDLRRRQDAPDELDCIVVVEEKRGHVYSNRGNLAALNADMNGRNKHGGLPGSPKKFKTTSDVDFRQPTLSFSHNGNCDVKSTVYMAGTDSDCEGGRSKGEALKADDATKPSSPSSSSSAAKKLLKHRNKSQQCKKYAKQFVAIVFSTVGVMCLMVAYTILGGYIFMRLEAQNEVKVKAEVRRSMQWHVGWLWTATENLNVLHRDNWTEIAQRVFDNFTREVYLSTKTLGYDYQKYEDQIDGLGEHQPEDDFDNDDEQASGQWNFAGSLLYSITVITTIGYGNIAPKTTAGMIVTMLYAIVGIPLTLLTVTNLGRMLAYVFRFLYVNTCKVAWRLICRRFCPCRSSNKTQQRTAVERHTSSTTSLETIPLRKLSTSCKADASIQPETEKPPTDGTSSPVAAATAAVVVRWRQRIPECGFVTDVSEIQKVSVPISVSLAVIAGYIALGALLFQFCEEWTFLEASYFCFITLSTIGFGDYVPGTSLDAAASQEKMVLCALYLVFGLAVLAMAFDLMQEEARNKFRNLGRRLGLIDDDDDD